MKKQSLVIVICAVLTALTFVFAFFPFVFFVPALFASICFGFGIGFFASTCFGVISLLLCLMFPTLNLFGAVGWYFVTYPWLPIVARMFIGPIVCLLYKFLTKIINQNTKIKKIIPISVAGAVGSLLNTLFVGVLIFIIGSDDLPKEYERITLAFLALWGVIEMLVIAVILPPVVLAVKRAVPSIFKKLDNLNNNSSNSNNNNGSNLKEINKKEEN